MYYADKKQCRRNTFTEPSATPVIGGHKGTRVYDWREFAKRANVYFSHAHQNHDMLLMGQLGIQDKWGKWWWWWLQELREYIYQRNANIERKILIIPPPFLVSSENTRQTQIWKHVETPFRWNDYVHITLFVYWVQMVYKLIRVLDINCISHKNQWTFTFTNKWYLYNQFRNGRPFYPYNEASSLHQ